MMGRKSFTEVTSPKSRMSTNSIIEFKRILENNGYRFLRHAKGDHCIYSNGERTITIKRTHVNKMIARRLIREYDLKVDD